MKAQIIRYISERYPRWHDLAAYLAEKQYFSDLSLDLLHEVLVSLLLMDESKIERLYESLKKDQNLRELDFFILRMIRLNAISETAPFRVKYQTSRKDVPLTKQEFKLASEEDEISEVDESHVKLRHIRLIRAIGEALELNEQERTVFNDVILCGETVASRKEGNNTYRVLYHVSMIVRKAIHLVLFNNGFTRIDPGQSNTRVEGLAKKFQDRYKINIQNKNTPFEQIQIIDNMKTQVYWKDNYAIFELSGNLERVGKIIQEIVNAFAGIGVTITDPQQLANVLDNQRRVVDYSLEQLVFDSLYPETPSGFNRSRYRDLIDLPDLTNLKAVFEPLLGYFGGIRLSDVIHWNVYSIQNGVVEILPKAKEKIEANWTEVAETPAELERLAAVQDLCKSLDKIAELSIENPSTYKLPGVVEYDEKANKFIPARTFVKIGGKSFYGLGLPQKEQSLKSFPSGNGPQGLTAETSDEERAKAMAESRNLKVSN